MSNSVWPHRWQPIRFPRPWDSPGKNTGLGCHFLLQCMKVKSESEVGQSCLTLSDPMDCSLPESSVHGIFQARVLEWGAITFSEINARPVWNFYLCFRVSLFMTPTYLLACECLRTGECEVAQLCPTGTMSFLGAQYSNWPYGDIKQIAAEWINELKNFKLYLKG